MSGRIGPSSRGLTEVVVHPVDGDGESLTSPSGAQTVKGGGRSIRVRSSDLAWAAGAILTVLVAAAIPMLYHQRYYFYGDTQVGSFGQWFHFGELLRAGHWPLIDLQSWRGGNFVAEGQWGLWNPLIMLIAVAASATTNAVMFATVVKLGTLVLAATGTFLLVRSYDAPAPAAYVAAVGVPLGGVTQYLDAPSWMTGLLVWALLPWAWWAIRRTMNKGANPFAALLASYLVVTVGYVYGTLFLALIIVVCLIDTLVARDRAAAVKVFVIGACAGLVALTVYLPGILSAGVTVRDGWRIFNDGQLVMDVRGLLASVLPTAVVPTSVTQTVFNPVVYMAWFLPLITWIDISRFKRVFRPLIGLVVMLTASTLWTLGPSDVGPIRWPLRVMPFVVLGSVVLAVVLVSKTVGRPSRGRLIASLLWVLFASYLSFARATTQWRPQLASLILVSAGIVLVWLMWRRLSPPERTRPAAARVAALAAFVGIWSVGLVLVQHHYYPSPPSAQRNMPTLVADYAGPLQNAAGDVMMLGDPVKLLLDDGAASRDFLIGSAWYVSPHPVQNTYTTIGYKSYVSRYCIGFIGNTCKRALGEMFSEEPTTGRRRVDLLSISTLLLVRKDFPPPVLDHPPAGWHVADKSPLAVTWVRDHLAPTAGGVVWSSPGTTVQQLSSSERTVRFRVRAVGRGGGKVAVSRLAWPGYSVDGGRLASAVDDYLLTVDVPASSTNKIVTVHYDPPAWALEVGAWYLGVGVGVLWSLLLALAFWRRRLGASPRAM